MTWAKHIRLGRLVHAFPHQNILKYAFLFVDTVGFFVKVTNISDLDKEPRHVKGYYLKLNNLLIEFIKGRWYSHMPVRYIHMPLNQA